MGTLTELTVREVLQLLDARYPQALAEDWDAVGLVCGDPNAPVRKVLFAVDPVAAVVDEALAWGADLLVTHHPLFLRPVHGVAATTFKGEVVHRLIRGGCALYVAHTNADSAPGGVADALAEAIGVVERRPLVPKTEPIAVGGFDQLNHRGPVASGAATAVGIGRVGRLPEPMTLESFARTVAAAIPATAQGVRVAGELDALVETVAVVGGAGDSLFDAVRTSGADVYVTADLRHHPASELREQAEFEAAASGRGQSAADELNRRVPYLIDLAHYASEWPWLEHAARDLVQAVPNGAATLETRVSRIITDPWTTVIRD